MVNQVVLDYLKKYADAYDLERLKQKIINSVYPKSDVDEAVKILGLANKKNVPVINRSVQQKAAGGSNWLKIAAIGGILVFVFSAIGGLIRASDLLSVVFSSLSGISFVLFYYGFFVLGKKYNNNFF